MREVAAVVEQMKRDLDEILKRSREFYASSFVPAPALGQLAASVPAADELAPARRVMPNRRTEAARRKLARERLLRYRKRATHNRSWRRWLGLAKDAGVKLKHPVLDAAA